MVDEYYQYSLKMANRAFSSSSSSLKAATVILLIVLIIHIIGFSIPRWVTVKFKITGYSFSTRTESGYHAGLWQHCGCTSVLSSGVCLCFSRTNDPAWFKMVQAAEILGLIGLVISVFLSLVLVCYKQNKNCKTANLSIVLISGALMLIGLIVFGIKTKEGLDQLGNFSDDVVQFKRGYGELSYAFILCVIAGCLCIVVCAPLYLKDMSAQIPETFHEPQVHYTARSQIVNPPQGYVQGGQPLVQYGPTHTHAQYGPPPEYVQYYQPGNRGIPYKS